MLVISNKDGRVSMKDVRRSGACEACRSRKRKCDGEEPCSSCVAKHWQCTYSQQKRRGPPKKFVVTQASNGTLLTQSQTISPSTYDSELADKLEALTLGDIYLKYFNSHLPATSRDKFLAPSNSSHKVQTYAALAYIARVSGDVNKANKYISQGRMLAGEIYDRPNPDSVSALLMMSNYWQLVYNLPQSAHYARMVTSLMKMLPSGTDLDYRVSMVGELNDLFCDATISNKAKAELLREKAQLVLTAHASKEQVFVMHAILMLSSYVTEYLQYNPMLSQVTSSNEFYCIFDNVHIDEAVRKKIIEECNKHSVTFILLKDTDEFVSAQLTILFTIFKPMFMAIVEWRSGHIIEALTFGITTIQNIQTMASSDQLAYSCGMLDYFIIGLLGGLCKFFLEIGQNVLAAQLNDKIKSLCKILSPEFDFLLNIAKEFDTWLAATNLSPAITPDNTTTIKSSNSNLNNTDYSHFNTFPTSNFVSSPNYISNNLNYSHVPSPNLTSSPNYTLNIPSPNFAIPSPTLSPPIEITSTTYTDSINNIDNNNDNNDNIEVVTFIPIQDIYDNTTNIDNFPPITSMAEFLARL